MSTKTDLNSPLWKMYLAVIAIQVDCRKQKSVLRNGCAAALQPVVEFHRETAMMADADKSAGERFRAEFEAGHRNDDLLREARRLSERVDERVRRTNHQQLWLRDVLAQHGVSVNEVPPLSPEQLATIERQMLPAGLVEHAIRQFSS